MQLIDVGFGNRVAAERVVAVVAPQSLPVKTLIASAREQSLLIDATQGRKTQGVIVTDSGHVVLSYLTPDRITEAERAAREEDHDEG